MQQSTISYVAYESSRLLRHPTSYTFTSGSDWSETTKWHCKVIRNAVPANESKTKPQARTSYPEGVVLQPKPVQTTIMMPTHGRSMRATPDPPKLRPKLVTTEKTGKTAR